MATTNNRKPGIIISHTRDKDGHRTNLVKSAWRKSGKVTPLKVFVQACLDNEDTFLGQIAGRWFVNKQVNPSHPPKGIGRTHGKKSAKTGTAAPKKSKREKD